MIGKQMKIEIKHGLKWTQFFCLSITLLIGCGASESGPQRFAYSGKVTYGEQPIQIGYISFEPDSTAGNSGPGTMVKIVDGHYQTPIKKGLLGGSYIILISGYDGVADADGLGEGMPLFKEYEIKMDLQKEKTELDLDVPQF